ncbi:MAG TPA: DUF2059 domain-containing protein [Methylomirabilota bacterium]|nr:DUF2059 domain-containing protein [Methylomirabilota bacterium]
MVRTLARHLGAAVIAILLAGPLAGPVQAQTFTDSHLAAARETIEAAKADQQFDNILIVLSDQAKTLFTRSNPSLVLEIDEVVNQVALDLAKRRPELDRELEQVWAARFTEEELKEITGFYTSPVGLKFGEMMSTIIQDSVRSASLWRDTLSSEMVTKSREELIKRGYQF